MADVNTAMDAMRAAMKALGADFLTANARLDDLEAAIAAAPEPEPAPDPEPEPEPQPDPEPAPDPEPVPDPVPPPSTVTFTPPPGALDGTAPRNGLLWNGHKWGNSSGQTWNPHVPYAIGLGDNALRFELRDTPNDHGLNDPDHKRRTEIGSADDFRNGKDHWFAFSVQVEIDRLNKALGNSLCQIKWPSGASPALAPRLRYENGEPVLTITTRGEDQGNTDRGTLPFKLGVPHDLVLHFRLGENGHAEAWLDGEKFVDFDGPVGTDKEDGYSLRLGVYGAPLDGMTIVAEYRNIAAFPETIDLSKRIANPPAW